MYRQAPARAPRRGPEGAADAVDGAALNPPTDPDDFKRGPYDLEPLTLPAAPPLDGYIDDWPQRAGRLAVIRARCERTSSPS